MSSHRHDAGRRACLKTVSALGIASFAPALMPRGAKAAAPARVVSLSWAGAQALISLGVAPVAVADRVDYPLAGTQPPLPADTSEVGAHDEPNLERVQQLLPELIVIDANQQALDARLQRIAPTFTLDIYNPQRGQPYTLAAQETLRLGARIGRGDAARRYLQHADDELATCAKTIAAREMRLPVLVVDLYDDGRHLYLYGGNSLIQDVMDRLGVRNAWQGSTGSGYLLQGIEALAAFGDAQMFYISHGVRDQIALHNLSRSVLWQHLPFVKANRFRPLPGFFAYGATASAVQFARELTAGLVAMQSQTGSTDG
ncbi:iron complex transport system substrate-binding protein [Paraburkholderia eburnea]|uniref:Iron complex transport system substrate-binding protein n=1 Tax=Paraburkholderia eburnea TaxID=1189126 RepID=A0A2S4LV95_9BURK|nr:ABC transporter substrate-binding protein [Paraburkholderia eburnea]POR46315.1 iron complex transport system substrate-binding protein [Paraburkholderia eburnea]PRZ16268.1 iron complex transport system substrate-binding protein [Paraburkholderia eburnea]